MTDPVDERAAIVAWLREQAEEGRNVGYVSGHMLADAIQAGAHLIAKDQTHD